MLKTEQFARLVAWAIPAWAIPAWAMSAWAMSAWAMPAYLYRDKASDIDASKPPPCDFVSARLSCEAPSCW